MSEKEQIFRSKFLPTMCWPSGIRSPQLDELRADFEDTTDAIAGPMHQYYEQGNVDYIFTGRHPAFKNVKTPEELFHWCQNVIAEFKDKVVAVSVNTDLERKEQKLLLHRIADIEELIKLFDECLRK